jgi:hypothetical protein
MALAARSPETFSMRSPEGRISGWNRQMSRIFISHSNKDACEALAFRQWLVGEGWSVEDIFIDLHGIGAGSRWREALHRANERCEAVVLLASPAALASTECLIEVRLAEDMGKEIIVTIAYGLTVDDPGLAVYRPRQIVDVSAEPLTVTVPVEHRDTRKTVHFSETGLAQIKSRLRCPHRHWVEQDGPSLGRQDLCGTGPAQGP